MPKYRFKQFDNVHLVNVAAGYGSATIRCGEAELDPDNPNDRAIIEEYGGALVDETAPDSRFTVEEITDWLKLSPTKLEAHAALVAEMAGPNRKTAVAALEKYLDEQESD